LPAEEVAIYPKVNPDVIYYEIIVRDNGIGFNQKYQSRFSRYSFV
jgi:hypothetical protein